MLSTLLIAVIVIDSCNHIDSFTNTDMFKTFIRSINVHNNKHTGTALQLFNLIGGSYQDMSLSLSVSPVYTVNQDVISNDAIKNSNNYSIRFIELKDISLVDQCNRNNLPENYNVNKILHDVDYRNTHYNSFNIYDILKLYFPCSGYFLSKSNHQVA